VRWLSRLVTVVVTVGVVAALALLIRSKMPSTSVGGSCGAWALFRDASRLAVGSPVKIAGVQVGEISRLTVTGELARADLVLRDDLDIPADAWITKRAESAFGDSYLEIIPVIAEEGAPSGQRLKCGGQLVHVQEGSSTDTVLRTISRAMPKIDRGLDAVHDFALSGRKWASGPLQDGIRGVDQWIAEGHIDQPVASADHAMEGFESGTQRAADAVHGVDVAGTLDRYNRAVLDARAKMHDFKAGLGSAMQNARDGMDGIDPTVRDFQDVVVAINQGSGEDWKGKLGRMVNEPELADSIEDTTDGLASGAAGLNRFHSWLGARYEYYLYTGLARAYATAELRSRNDKFYLIEAEKGPLGDLPREELADVLDSASHVRSQEIKDGLRFTLQFGKTFGKLQLRGGIKESTPGVGADVLLREGKLRLSTDVFGSFTHVPRVKVAAALELFSGIYVLAGVDDALSSPGYLPVITGNTDVPIEFNKVRYGRDYFLGATLQFTDADLATLIRVYGALIVGFLL
jgi:phospholipid/cholesterol/gamma-HCH transport system substrate-binding protein